MKRGAIRGQSGPLKDRPRISPRFIQATRVAPSRPVQELKRVNRRGSFADLEVELRRPHLTRLTRFGNDLAALDRIAALYHQFTRMSICGAVTVGVPHQNQITVTLELVARTGEEPMFRR